MGYELHITRADDWIASDQDPISLEEWLACVAGDPELSLESSARAPLGDGVEFELTLPGLARWNSWSRHNDPGAKVYLWHCDGGIVSRGIDAEVTAKLYRIAQQLGARVFGDEGEEYGPDGEVLSHGEEPLSRAEVEPSQAEVAPPRRSWWRRLLGM